MSQEEAINFAKAIVGYKIVHGCTLEEAKAAIIDAQESKSGEDAP